MQKNWDFFGGEISVTLTCDKDATLLLLPKKGTFSSMSSVVVDLYRDLAKEVRLWIQELLIS